MSRRERSADRSLERAYIRMVEAEEALRDNPEGVGPWAYARQAELEQELELARLGYAFWRLEALIRRACGRSTAQGGGA